MNQRFEPIPASLWSPLPEGVHRYDETAQEEIAELLMGRSVTKVDGEHLLLDDGTVIRAVGHEGGCACSAGDYDLTVLNGVDNIITKVEFDDHPASDGDAWDGPNEAKVCDPTQDDYTGHYRIFVFAGDERINLMQFDGSDGNGYYGTGYSILVRRSGDAS